MIVLDRVSKIYPGNSGSNAVLQDVSFTIHRGDSIGICGANGVGKSTLMKLLSGVERPTAGTVTRTMSVSWPIGLSQAFQPSLTGADNARFVARVYGKDERELLEYVDDFAQLGRYMDEPVRIYSAGMQARLAFGVSLAVQFDCYLVDEITGVGDERFRARSQEALEERKRNGTLIMVSHDSGTLLRYCDKGAVVYAGGVTMYDTITEAVDIHHRLQSFPQQRR